MSTERTIIDRLVTQRLATLADRRWSLRPVDRTVAGPPSPTRCRACGTTEALWPGRGHDDERTNTPQKARQLRGPDREGHDSVSTYSPREGVEHNFTAKYGFLKVYRLKYHAVCTEPTRFATLQALPGVSVEREWPSALQARVEPDALRPVARLLGFRAPVRAVETLVAAYRKAVLRADRRQERRARSSPGPGSDAVPGAGSQG